MRLIAQLMRELRETHPWIRAAGKRTHYHPTIGFGISGLNFDPSIQGDDAVFVRPFLHMPCPPRGYWTLSYGSRIPRGRLDWWHLADLNQYQALFGILNEHLLPQMRVNAFDEGALTFIERSDPITRGPGWRHERAMIYLSLRRYSEAEHWLRESRKHLDSRNYARSSADGETDAMLRRLTEWFNESPERARAEAFACRAEGLRLLKVADAYEEIAV